MDKSILAYTAGLFDGEGTVSLIQNNSNEFKAPYVSLTSTTKDLVDFLKEHFGGTIVSQKTYADHHKPAWIWRLTHRKAIDFLDQIAAFMREPEKVRRAQLIINEYPALTKRNGRYTEDDIERKLCFESSFFHPSTA